MVKFLEMEEIGDPAQEGFDLAIRHTHLCAAFAA
jgi:hypothetical protein